MYDKKKDKLIYRINEYGGTVLTPYGLNLQRVNFEYECRVKVMEREYLDLLYENKKIKALSQYKDLSIKRQRQELSSKDEIIKKLKSQIPAAEIKKED